uniref:Chloride channel protein n=2 Tax=Entomoneis paludosa TaxID=265537 RepID=A0A7S3DQ29_9STRA|mmetsp:Transcript_27659/g.57897  ORF Transcript_27659/g.57897 Transcript_27659/m.57897 type:complete len:592 (+) Transcript_27659:88-1863(+)|eukprot:CAMPEP_0172458976 /NCGR_PEP_ID=MMETSP1065-20121228/30364_1 /TAXON_ID=265537 /ORGANISM="Amphiprora paludosa, Strain CCMP125" /LENGTH=591 /DNA_ID=CAMNT_0013213489 /DNA_START=81 /DNA_END=1856 /DNA_ORIENTATION=-
MNHHKPHSSRRNGAAVPLLLAAAMVVWTILDSNSPSATVQAFSSAPLLFPTPHPHVSIRHPVPFHSGSKTCFWALRNAPTSVEPTSNSTFLVNGNAADDGAVNDSENDQANASKQQDSTTTTTTTTENAIIPNPRGQLRQAWFLWMQAASVGILTGLGVALFKMGIHMVQNVCYPGTTTLTSTRHWGKAGVPALGGLIVALLGKYLGFSAGIKDTIQEVDTLTTTKATTPTSPRVWKFLPKTMAAAITLGSGASLGPEGPAVELGMNLSRWVSRSIMAPNQPNARLLLACGAAAGVAAGFAAPLAGVFFALEIVQANLSALDQTAAPRPTTTTTPPLTATRNTGAILVSSVVAALVCHALLGHHAVLHLPTYVMSATPLLELPVMVGMGVVSGGVAFVFQQAIATSRSLFQRKWGRLSIPKLAQPVVGGLISGLLGVAFPAIMFGGWSTLNALLANQAMPTTGLLTLLAVKLGATAVAAGSGLVGGTFAPSLFLGGMVGAAYANLLGLVSSRWVVSLPAYTLVGAATVLAAVFGAPLTASLLVLELTQHNAVGGAILPLLASCGVASGVCHALQAKQAARKALATSTTIAS